MPPGSPAAHAARSKQLLPRSTARPSEKGLRVTTRSTARGTIVSPAGEVDGGTVAEFEGALKRAIAAREPIEIDLRAVTFVDSSALWAITAAQSECRMREIPLTLRPGPERVQQVFEVTGLADLLPFTSERGI